LGLLPYLSLCAEAFLNIIFIIRHLSNDPQIRISIRSALTIAIISAFLSVLTVNVFFFLIGFLNLIEHEFFV
jgi:hypothetical protein